MRRDVARVREGESTGGEPGTGRGGNSTVTPDDSTMLRICAFGRVADVVTALLHKGCEKAQEPCCRYFAKTGQRVLPNGAFTGRVARPCVSKCKPTPAAKITLTGVARPARSHSRLD